MLSQRPNRTLIRAARAQINGGSVSSSVRQIWALCAPVIPLRIPAAYEATFQNMLQPVNSRVYYQIQRYEW